MDNKQSKDITITGVEIKNGRYKIFDQDRTWYAFFKTKQDGSKSSAYEQWESMGLDQGSAVNVSFVAEEKEYQGKPFTDRRVIWFRETNGTPEGIKTAPQAKSPARGQNLRSSEDVDWDEIAVGKCQTAFLAAFLQAGNTFADTKLQVTQARKLAELVVYGQQLPQRDPIPDDPTNGQHNGFVNDDEPPLEEPPF